MTEEQKKRFAHALARLSNDCDLLSDMATMVMADSGDVLKRLRAAIADNDCSTAARTAHQLKGMLSTFETGWPVTGLQQMIDSAREDDPPAMKSDFAAAEANILGLLDEIDQLRPLR